MERHRLAHLVATTKADLDYSAVLHVAPEPQVEAFLRAHSTDYLSIDLFSPLAMAKMDVTALDLADESMTLVWISHVLEHVRRDDLAISELHRVLKPGGVAFVQVPIWRLKTFEDESITSEEDRLRIFYQKDHVRLYGLDIIERFEAAGFEATVIRAQDFGSDLLIEHQLSFASTDEVFLFRKR
jgi:SAM-dependent methyltransferase